MVLCILQSSNITRASPWVCFVSYLGHSLDEFSLSAETRKVYSTAPVDWASHLSGKSWPIIRKFQDTRSPTERINFLSRGRHCINILLVHDLVSRVPMNKEKWFLFLLRFLSPPDVNWLIWQFHLNLTAYKMLTYVKENNNKYSAYNTGWPILDTSVNKCHFSVNL